MNLRTANLAGEEGKLSLLRFRAQCAVSLLRRPTHKLVDPIVAQTPDFYRGEID
jgi:hypothetical protein